MRSSRPSPGSAARQSQPPAGRPHVEDLDEEKVVGQLATIERQPRLCRARVREQFGQRRSTVPQGIGTCDACRVDLLYRLGERADADRLDEVTMSPFSAGDADIQAPRAIQ
jgi:hypothetical protein